MSRLSIKEQRIALVWNERTHPKLLQRLAFYLMSREFHDGARYKGEVVFCETTNQGISTRNQSSSTEMHIMPRLSAIQWHLSVINNRSGQRAPPPIRARRTLLPCKSTRTCCQPTTSFPTADRREQQFLIRQLASISLQLGNAPRYTAGRFTRAAANGRTQIYGEKLKVAKKDTLEATVRLNRAYQALM